MLSIFLNLIRNRLSWDLVSGVSVDFSSIFQVDFLRHFQVSFLCLLLVLFSIFLCFQTIYRRRTLNEDEFVCWYWKISALTDVSNESTALGSWQNKRVPCSNRHIPEYSVPLYRLLLCCYREEKAWVKLDTVGLGTGGFSLAGHLNIGCEL